MKITVLPLLAFLLCSCNRTPSPASAKYLGPTCLAGSIANGEYTKFWEWRHGNGKNAEGIDLIVFSDFNPGTKCRLGGANPLYGSGYHDMDGQVVTFSRNGDYGFVILDKVFDLQKGRFFHVYRESPDRLAVRQEGLSSDLAQQVLAQ